MKTQLVDRQSFAGLGAGAKHFAGKGLLAYGYFGGRNNDQGLTTTPGE
jgi:hypothetical protein